MKIAGIIFLIIVCILAGVFQDRIFFSIYLTRIENQIELPILVRLLQFFSGFVVPLIPLFLQYFVFYTINHFVSKKNISNLFWVIYLGLIPFYLFILLNWWFIFDHSFSKLALMNESGQGEIVPFISLKLSTQISSILKFLPALVLFVYLKIKVKYLLIDALIIAILPILFFILFSTIYKII
jgi:hypothetical protein